MVDCTRIEPPKTDCPVLGFYKSHIKEAQFLDSRYLRNFAIRKGISLCSEADFTEQMKRLQIKLKDRVVLYDRFGNINSPRIYWLFRAMGH